MSGTQVTTEPVERGAQLDELHAWLVAARAGEGRVVFVSGEAGVGKTTLVRRFCRDVAGQIRLLSGACERLATPAPLGPILDMAPDLARTAALLAGGAPPVDIRRSFLEEIAAEPAGTLVVIEDAHWADEATLDLLRYVARRLETSPAMLVVTYRQDELDAGQPLRVLAGDLATLPVLRRLLAPALSVDAVRALCAGSGLDPERLHGLTGGNAFFVSEILAAGSAGEVPASVRDAVLARAARLRPGARRVLDAAACLGGSVAPWLVEHVSGEGPAEIDECVALGVLLDRDGEIAFRHELARATIEEAVGVRRAAAYHARAVEALAGAAPVDPSRVAYHARRAGDDASLLKYGKLAADGAAAAGAVGDSGLAYFWLHHVAVVRRRYALADRWYAEAMPYLEDHDAETWREWLRSSRARALFEQGHWDAAEVLAAEVVRHAPVEDGRKMIAMAVLGRLRARRRDPDAVTILDELHETMHVA